MKLHHVCAVILGMMLLCSLSAAQVLVTDSGVDVSIAGPGAPAHVIGLERLSHTITLYTGATKYGLRYIIARDPERPGVAIPGEGYIGMSDPTGANWYTGGFFDLQLNGKSIGTTPIHSLTGRSSGNRGTADFVFDAPEALVRIRFVALEQGDCLFAQVLLEPKEEITSVRLRTRCYPSGFISDSERHVMTPVRDFTQGEQADLDVANEWWTLYYDRVYDAGFAGPARKGVGPCSMLWLPEQTESVGFTVAGYGIDTGFALKPDALEYRFIFFDHAGRKNADAMEMLQAHGEALRQELADFVFVDPALTEWPLEEKRAEIERVLATMPEEQEMAANYQQWALELEQHFQAVRSAPAGAIMAEAEAARIIADWEAGLPELRLRDLLNRI